MHRYFLHIIVGIFCTVCFPAGATAQSLTAVAETDRFTEYLFVNDSLSVVHPYEFLVHPDEGTTHEVVEQQVVNIAAPENIEGLIEAHALSSTDTNLFETSNVGQYRGTSRANLVFHPVRFSESGSTDLTLVKKARFRVYHPDNGNRPAVRSSQKAASSEPSPLATGEWYKIPIDEKGIYSIDFEYLVELGVTPGQIDPEQIQIWGTPGGELPRLNSADTPQFQQIPILIEGEADGEFNQEDQILFYADSPHHVERDPDTGAFSHQIHRYSRSNYVFLLVNGQDESSRITELPSSGSGVDITEFRDFLWVEEDLAKADERIRSGLEWYGLRFSNSSGQQQRTVAEETIPGLISGREMDVEIEFVGRSTQSMSMSFSYGNTSIGSSSVLPINSYGSEEGVAGRKRNVSSTVQTANSEEIALSGQLNASEPTSEGMIDWVRLTYDRSLTADNNYLYIYSPADILNQPATYRLRGFTESPLVLDVTNPVNPRQLDLNGTAEEFQFSFDHQQQHEFIAQATPFIPEIGRRVTNQDLRGNQAYPDYIIVTSEPFFDLAQDWAGYRQDENGYEVIVATQEQIFNEFSGGVPDVTAIRDFVKFHYDKALNNGQEPLQHLLLFGDATYDYRGIREANLINHVFTFQSDESLNRIDSYGSDDYFGLLDDDEGEWRPRDTSERLDIGIGRFPVSTQAEARTLMDKIRHYESDATTGNWKTRFSFVSDDDFPDRQRNRDLHLLNADGTAQEINKVETATQVNKIHMLSYPVETSAAGRRVPGATDDMIRAFNDGSLIVNYSGHGGQFVLADEQLFTTEMISRLNNRDRLSIFVTATCQFGRFDDTDSRSGAEESLLYDRGGIAAAFTTTRVVYTSSSTGSNNFGLNIQLTRQMLERDENGLPRKLGDIYRSTKNTSQGSGDNARKFILLGDPAMRLGIPEREVEITRINELDLQAEPDSTVSVRALDKMRVEGIVTDTNGNQITDFNGETTITVFDSERIVNLPSDIDWVQEERCFTSQCNYRVENDILFNGRVSVQNGAFSTEFIIPQDITFSDDPGRILIYSSSNGTDGSGSAGNVIFNGVNPDAEEDSNGPAIDAYLNDTNFVNGNLVGSSSTLIVDLEDESGINTTGNGVGHEIIATIDTSPRQTIVLNEFYQSDLDDFRKGRIEYPLDDVSEGNYTLTVRAWDVYNNPEETSIHFEVADSDQLKIRNVYNYPNPMSRNTRFVFEHNQPGSQLDISIRIYTLSGMPVTHLHESQITSNSYANIEWNGIDRDYDRLANGTYIYVLRVGTDTPEGKQVEEKIEKLVIIR